MHRIAALQTFITVSFALALALVLASAFSHAEEPRLTWQSDIKVAKGSGHRGPWQMNKSRYLFVDDPTVAVDANGAIAVAWANQSKKDIFLQIYEANGSPRFAFPVNISRSPQEFSWLPRMLIDPNNPNNIHVLWQEIVFSGGSHGGEIFFSTSTNGGRSFGKVQNLSKSKAGDGKGRLSQRRWHNGSLDLAMAADGTLYAAWSEYEGSLRFSRSTDGGKQFSPPREIDRDADPLPARAPALATDGSRVYLAWSVGEDMGSGIRLATSINRGGSFGKQRIITTSAGRADAPKLVTDSRSTLHLVFSEAPASNPRIQQVRYSQSADGGRTFTSATTLSKATILDSGGASFPSLSIDSQDRIYVLWEHTADGTVHPQGLELSYSADRGQSFSSPIRIPAAGDKKRGWNGSQQGLLMKKLAVNPAGTIAIVNSRFIPQNSSHIWLYRGSLGKENVVAEQSLD